MSLLWEDRSPNEPQPHRREPEPEPTRQQQRRLSPSGLLAIQQGAGNHAATAMLSRFKDRSDLGKDLVWFDESEPQPKMMKLASDPGFQYQARFGLGDRIYERTPKGASFQVAKVDPLEKEKREREQLKEKLATAQPTLFDQTFGGDKEGTFEYVANYLYGEVFSVSKEEAQKIWDRVYTVDDKPLTPPTLKRKEIHGKRKLLSDMIDIGLDANWKKVPVQELVKTTVEGGAMPGKDMQTTVWTDYLAASDDGTTKPMKTLGVGFHTTDGPPGAVAKAKKDGGWGGVTRPITVDFFRKRYALDQTGWNPLGAWLAKAGPTFRKGIKDNELLSTVSVATATHGSVRFPLADTPGRKGTHKVRHAIAGAEQDTFHMQVVHVRRAGRLGVRDVREAGRGRVRRDRHRRYPDRGHHRLDEDRALARLRGRRADGAGHRRLLLRDDPAPAQRQVHGGRAQRPGVWDRPRRDREGAGALGQEVHGCHLSELGGSAGRSAPLLAGV